MVLEIDNTTTTGLDWCARGKERIVQNIVNILNTYKYEVAYMRGFGMSADAIDKPLEEMRSIITEDLFDNIKQYEPRATLKAVTIKEINEDGGVIAVVQIEI